MIFKNAVVGRRQGDGWGAAGAGLMQRSWVEAGSTFSAVLLFALATGIVAVVVYPVALAATALYVCPGWSSGHHEPYERQFLGDLILGVPA